MLLGEQRGHGVGAFILGLLCGLSGIQHVWDIRRSQRAKPVPWGPWGWLSSHPPGGFWAAAFRPAGCSSIWNVSAPWRKPALRDAFLSPLSRGSCARPAHAAPWPAAPGALPRTAADDLPWAAAHATSWAAAAASAKLPGIPGVWECHPRCASIPGECPPCVTLCPGLGPKGLKLVAQCPLTAGLGRAQLMEKGSVLHL